MGGTRIGGKKTAQHLKKTNPNYYRDMGRIGGKAKVKKGFAVSGKASEAGKVGGTKSRRGPNRQGQDYAGAIVASGLANDEIPPKKHWWSK